MSGTVLPSEILIYPELPLAVYREIAAHVQQLPGVQARLLPPNHTHFDYGHSQVGGLELTFNEQWQSGDRQRLEAIITFYGQRYGQPQRQMTNNPAPVEA